MFDDSCLDEMTADLSQWSTYDPSSDTEETGVAEAEEQAEGGAAASHAVIRSTCSSVMATLDTVQILVGALAA